MMLCWWNGSTLFTYEIVGKESVNECDPSRHMYPFTMDGVLDGPHFLSENVIVNDCCAILMIIIAIFHTYGICIDSIGWECASIYLPFHLHRKYIMEVMNLHEIYRKKKWCSYFVRASNIKIRANNAPGIVADCHMQSTVLLLLPWWRESMQMYIEHRR